MTMMNDKQRELYRMLRIVVSCCVTEMPGGSSVSCEDIMGRPRTGNAVMTRCILVRRLLTAGYSVATVAQFLGRSAASIRYMLNLDRDFLRTSRAYRIATEEVSRLLGG